jgi:hypothetical protein
MKPNIQKWCRRAVPMVFACAAIGAGCGDNQDGSGLDGFLPPIPSPTGEAQKTFAGEITMAKASELLKGPAASGMVGDFFIRNDKVSFVVQSATRVIGVIPQGGNLIDAVLNDGTKQTVDDHFGEMSLIYLLGRTCEHTTVEVLADGSGGGVAAIRARGKSGNNDFINLKGIGVLPVNPTVDPDIPDDIECATTYILEPGASRLAVYHTLYNAGKDKVSGPLGTMTDTGGATESWGNLRGFERLGVESLASLSNPSPIDYVLYQGPGVAYGIIPRHDQPTKHGQFLIAGVSILLVGNDALLDILDKTKYYINLAPTQGFNQRYDVAVGKDAAQVDEVFRVGNAEALTTIGGTVNFSKGTAASGARVGIFRDDNGNGTLDATDRIESYADVDATGRFTAKISAGNHLVRAEVQDVGRSAVVAAGPSVTMTIPSPIKVDFSIVDDQSNGPIPGRLLVIGTHPVFPDSRVFSSYDRLEGVVASSHNIRGTTVDIGDGADPAMFVPAGGTYRVYASRGTEYSFDSKPVSGTADVNLSFRLRRVAPATGYYSTEWHVHQVGSPDSPVLSDERVRSAASAGVEMFAVTDHDFVSDLQPLVESLHLQNLLRVLPGIEVTPFAYGHFNAWPMQPLNDDASNGAIDWARTATGLSMTPKQIYDAMRARGSKMVQVNHPRNSGLSQFQAFFDRANLKYDFASRMIVGDFTDPNIAVPNDFLRLPEESLWSPTFNGLEIWNGFTMADTNMDGVREIVSLDRAIADWFNMLSLGFFVSPAGNSDTHTSVKDPIGMPRTYVRVADDSPSLLASGAAVEEVLATQTRKDSAGASVPNDIVVSNGPMIEVKNGTTSAIGHVIAATATGVTFTVTMTAADWAQFDTLEVFANSTPKAPVAENSSITPLKCWTSRSLATLKANDPCKLASLAAESMTVTLAATGGGLSRYEATVIVTIDKADILNRAGAIGKDAWMVFRVRGDRAIFPIMPDGVLGADLLPVALTGDRAQLATMMAGHGVAAAAITSPVFIDFDGGGYRAPFAP